MLSKALKHDLRSILPLWLFLSAVTFCTSFVMGFCMRDLVLGLYEDGFRTVFSVLGVSLSVLIIVCYSIATVIFVAVRYYQNFFTDEGYLTFTLPVKRSTLFFSKVLSGVILIFSAVAVVLVTVAVALLFVPASSVDATPMLFAYSEEIVTLFGQLFHNYNLPTLGLQIAACVAIALACIVYQVLVIYLCITVGSVVAKKWKVAAAILCYYLANVLINVFSGIAQFVMLLLSSSFWITLASLSPVLSGISILMLLLIVLGFFIILSAAIYRVNIALIEKKLNLA